MMSEDLCSNPKSISTDSGTTCKPSSSTQDSEKRFVKKRKNHRQQKQWRKSVNKPNENQLFLSEKTGENYLEYSDSIVNFQSQSNNFKNVHSIDDDKNNFSNLITNTRL